MFVTIYSWIYRQFFQHKAPVWHNMSAVTALKLRFETLLSTRPIHSSGKQYGMGQNCARTSSGGVGRLSHRNIRHGTTGDSVWDFSDFHADVSSIFFSFPKISFCVLIGMYLSEFKHKGAEMQRGDRTSLQSCVEPRTESTLLFVLRGTSHQKLPWCSGTSECLGS